MVIDMELDIELRLRRIRLPKAPRLPDLRAWAYSIYSNIRVPDLPDLEIPEDRDILPEFHVPKVRMPDVRDAASWSLFVFARLRRLASRRGAAVAPSPHRGGAAVIPLSPRGAAANPSPPRGGAANPSRR